VPERELAARRGERARREIDRERRLAVRDRPRRQVVQQRADILDRAAGGIPGAPASQPSGGTTR